MDKKVVKISTEYITLGQILKLCGFVCNGGEAKLFLASNSIQVNGQQENRRGKKLFENDVLNINDKEFVIRRAE